MTPNSSENLPFFVSAILILSYKSSNLGRMGGILTAKGTATLRGARRRAPNVHRHPSLKPGGVPSKNRFREHQGRKLQGGLPPDHGRRTRRDGGGLRHLALRGSGDAAGRGPEE